MGAAETPPRIMLSPRRIVDDGGASVKMPSTWPAIPQKMPRRGYRPWDAPLLLSCMTNTANPVNGGGPKRRGGIGISRRSTSYAEGGTRPTDTDRVHGAGMVHPLARRLAGGDEAQNDG